MFHYTTGSYIDMDTDEAPVEGRVVWHEGMTSKSQQGQILDASSPVCPEDSPCRWDMIMTDTCSSHGDSGGPVWRVENGVGLAIGIVSTGYGCGNSPKLPWSSPVHEIVDRYGLYIY